MTFNLGGGPFWNSCIDLTKPGDAAAETIVVNLGDWVEFTAADGKSAYRLEVAHSLNSQNLWFVGEDATSSAWINKNYEYITDNSFYLIVRNEADRYIGKLHIFSTNVQKSVQPPTGTIGAFVETFGINKWIETGVDTGIYTATFDHGLNTDVIEFNFFTDTNCPYLLCAKSKSASQLIVETASIGRRGGRVFIERVV